MTPDTAKALVGFLSESLRREQAVTLKVLQAVPETHLDYKPAEKSTAALDLAWHLAASEVALVHGAATGEFKFAPKPEGLKTAADVVAWYKEHSVAAQKAAASMTVEQATKVLDPFGGMPLPGVAFLNMAINHAIHHRGQLSTYLRPMGGKVPAIYGGSADEPFKR